MDNENLKTTISNENIAESSPTLSPRGFLAKLRLLPKKIWIAIIVAVSVLIVAVPLAADMVTNNYKTPLDVAVKVANSRKFSIDDHLAAFNGFTEGKFKLLMNIAKNSNAVGIDDLEEVFESRVEEYEEEYGNNYKFSYEIEDKDKLSKDERKAFKRDLADIAEKLQSIVDQTENLNSDEWEDMAGWADLSVVELKTYMDVIKSIANQLKNAKVEEGYELTVTMIIRGSKLDEPEEEKSAIRVYKVNGRWISEDFLEAVFSFIG